MLRPFTQVLFRSPLQSLKDAYVSNPEMSAIFEEGLYLSSPEFWQEFQKLESLNAKEREKMVLSFSKYWLRSSVRCTPYGTFAGSSLASISKGDSKIILSDKSSHRRSLRLDMNYMAEIVNALVQLPVVREQMLFVANNSLYSTSNAYRYAEYYIKNNTRSYQLTAVDKSIYLEKILRHTQQGKTMKALVASLVAEDDVTEKEASGFINELWLSQLLIPVLEPSVTGREPLDQVIAQLELLEGVEGILSQLKDIQSLLANPNASLDFYKEIELKLDQLQLGITIPKNTIQTDLFLNTHAAQLNEDLIEAVVRQAEDLKALAKQRSNAELDEFIQKFYARYEEKSIPLALALDADLGIGYTGVTDQLAAADEWVNGLAIDNGKGKQSTTIIDYLQQFSLRKYQDWLANSNSHIDIQEEELNAFKEQTKAFKFSNSMYLMGSFMKQDGCFDKEHFVFNASVFGGPSAANLLGRFTHGDDNLCALTKDVLAKEELEYPDAVYAEIAHLPQARIGNILLRPVLRKYEIPYVGLSGVDAEHQITIDDLYVSVRNNEVFLFSKRLNKRVIPRLTTAHNFGFNSLPVYKFLCDLQGQGLAYANVWDWGALSMLKHLPRVVYKNLIILKAVWKIEEKDISDMPKERTAYAQYFETLRHKHKIPQRVVYKEGDNELLIDFNQNKGLELFLHYIKRYKKIELEEFLFTEDNCIVHDEQGNPFTNEVIIPLYEDIEKESMGITTTKRSSFDSKYQTIRSFSPYSEWLYFKVYCGAKSAEKILATILLPFIEEGRASQLFEQFFFIRYKDESGEHFRIRFYNSVVEKQLALFQRFMQMIQPIIENGTVEKVMLDTYNRELERYTPQLTVQAETLFYHDSIAVLKFINLLDGIDGDQYRMLFALRGIDMLLTDFGLSTEQKGGLLKRMQGGFFKEFGAHPTLQKQLNDRYRKHQSFFVNHFKPELDADNEIDEAVNIFINRSEMNKPVVEEILNHLNETDDRERIFCLLESYIHMYMNRLFIAQQRKYELVAYHFLDRYYSSQIAIAKKMKKDIAGVQYSSLFKANDGY